MRRFYSEPRDPEREARGRKIEYAAKRQKYSTIISATLKEARDLYGSLKSEGTMEGMYNEEIFVFFGEGEIVRFSNLVSCQLTPIVTVELTDKVTPEIAEKVKKALSGKTEELRE